ncbi:4-coumarate-CoA ligase [Exophiala viscosa]|uniref:4-coumarate-CoA ligase n=1 Tax=Exophiala viscosa TaxID=2486360 RepID=UPI0021960477|nr:4-coumarate-CoA ligase [Exophiala viscosa]
MPFQSPYPQLTIPKCNILDYVFPTSKPLSNAPIWMEAADPSNSLSQSQMLSWVKRFALGLDRFGIQEGRTIMVFTPNHIYVPMAYLAAAGSKRIFTGANPIYTVDEVAFQMKTIEAALVLIHPSLLETGLKAVEQAQIPVSRVFQFAAVECSVSRGIKDWRTLVASTQDAETYSFDPLLGDASIETIAAINFSSGTTGLPKGVCVSHHNIVSNAAQCLYSKFHGTEQTESDPGEERWLAFLPLYHAYSQLFSIGIAGRLQIPVYVMAKFSFEEFLSYIERFKITTLQTVPPILVMLSKRPEATKYDISSVRHILCGAAPLSRELQNEISTRYKVVVAQGWGMTETTSAGALTPGMMQDQTGSIGFLLPNTEAMLVNEDGKENMKEGDPGELYIRGPQIMLKYWKNEKATKESITPDGWLRTGDVAVIKQDKIWLVDRKKELIKVNGLQVAPAELEAILLENEAVADAGVTGITVHGQELPRAYVVPQQGSEITTDDVQNFVAKQVAKHKRLTGGAVFVDEIPRLPSGKIVRKLLKEWGKRDAEAIEGRTRAKL